MNPVCECDKSSRDEYHVITYWCRQCGLENPPPRVNANQEWSCFDGTEIDNQLIVEAIMEETEGS